MKGLYICKTYRKNIRTGEIFPVLKYGKTNNIETRMKYYNKKSTYKLLAFFPVKNYLDKRESFIQNEYEEYRLTRNEHIKYEKGSFKILYNQVKEAASVEIFKTKNGFMYKDATL